MITTLTPRERDVARLVGKLKRNRQIADYLDIESFAVSFYVSSILKKTGAKDRPSLRRLIWDGKVQVSE